MVKKPERKTAHITLRVCESRKIKARKYCVKKGWSMARFFETAMDCLMGKRGRK